MKITSDHQNIDILDSKKTKLWEYFNNQ